MERVDTKDVFDDFVYGFEPLNYIDLKDFI